MSISQTRKKTLAHGMPEKIESPEGKLLYLYLDVNGLSSVTEVVTSLDIPRITAYSILGTLESRGVVERIGSDAYRSIA